MSFANICANCEPTVNVAKFAFKKTLIGHPR